MYLIDGKEGTGIRFLRPRSHGNEPFLAAVIDWNIFRRRLTGSWFIDGGVMLLASLSSWIGKEALMLSIVLAAVQFAHLAWKASWAASPIRITIDASAKILPAPMAAAAEHCTFVASIGFLIAVIDRQTGFLNPLWLLCVVETLLIAAVAPIAGFLRHGRR